MRDTMCHAVRLCAVRITDAVRTVRDAAGGRFVWAASAVFLTSLMPLCSVEQQESGYRSDVLEAFLKSGDYESFLRAAGSSPLYAPSRNSLVLGLDAGLAELFSGEYTRGAKRLSGVADQSERYYTKSLTRQALSILTNDLTLPYYGEDYEVSLATSASMIGFAANGDMEAVLVEARRGEHRLAVMSDAWEGDDKYRDDAFTHFLAGLMYETAGRMDDARISYTLADSVYGSRFFPMKPRGVAEGLRRVRGDGGGSAATLQPVLFATGETVSVDAVTSRPLVLCAFTGQGPVKDETIVRAHFMHDGIDHAVKMAIPVIRERPGSIRRVRAIVDGAPSALELAADYNHIATNTFNDRKALLYTRTLARVSARYIVLRAAKEKTVEKLRKKYDEAREKHGEDSSEAAGAWLSLKTASIGLDILANELLEHADTRSSLALPGQVYAGRVTVAPGVHTVTVEYLDAAGRVISRQSKQIEAVEGGAFAGIFSALW